ncbi:unnamed protein product, partial [marine sediment metagenome]
CYEHDLKEPIVEAVVGIKHFSKTIRVVDRDNLLASLKPIWDGFTDGGIWADDRDVTFLPVIRRKDAINPRIEVMVYRMSPAAWDLFVESLTPLSSCGVA